MSLPPKSRNLFRGVFPILALASVVGIYCGVDPRTAQAPNSFFPPPDRPKSSASPLPAALRVAMVQATQKEGGKEYAVIPFADPAQPEPSLRMHSPQKGVWAQLDQQGLHLGSLQDQASQTPLVSMSLSAYGCDGSLRSAKPVHPRVADQANRAEYHRTGMTEWYVNGPLGIEQGFTIDKDPGCTESSKLAIELSLDGQQKLALVGQGAQAHIEVGDSQAAPVLHYGDLYALDADGKELPAKLSLTDRTVRLEIEAAGARYPVTVDPTWTEQQKLLASNKATNSFFGCSAALSLDGNTAIIGAYQESESAIAGGAAYVFTRSGTTWTEQQKLLASDRAGADQFGSSVALSGDGNIALIGASGSDDSGTNGNGAAYIFTRSGSTWTQQQKLLASDKATGDNFGASVALSTDGTTALIGADKEDDSGTTSNGAAYLFTQPTTTWVQQQKLLASDKATSDDFGSSVALSSDGKTALIGAISKSNGTDAAAGAAYAFKRGMTLVWTEQAILLPSDEAAEDEFGSSVALSSDGNTALIGAQDKDDTGSGFSHCGAAYAFIRSGSTWTQQKKFLANDRADGDFFGDSVTLTSDGNTALIGAGQASVSPLTGNGAAYIYTRSGSVWSFQQKLLASDKSTNAGFGSSVAFSSDGSTALIGASSESSGGTTRNGAAYVFSNITTLPNGSACTAGAQCTSGNCVDLVCCDTTCGGGSDSDCQACSSAKGAAVNGTCGTTQATANFTCRAAADVCDVAATCDGTSTVCPANGFKPSTTSCRASAGACDTAENCTGSSAACPADVLVGSGIQCRAAADLCDNAATCDGSSPLCPANTFKPSTTSCRASAGACDVAENCTGSTAACPADVLVGSGIQCRAAAGVCDNAASCSGSSPICPANTFKPSTTSCRASAGACDVAESCTGSAAACPADVLVGSGIQCRAATDLCDNPASCNGSSPICPANTFKPSTTSCRASAGACDVAENCTGSAAACPADVLVGAGIQCRAATDLCDNAASCTGSNPACPANTIKPVGTQCRAATGLCDNAATCTGMGVVCPANSLKPGGTVCRPAAGTCDVAESCSGSAASCPADTLVGAGTVCRATAGACDVAESCTGSSGICPTDSFMSSGTVCRGAVGPCDQAENCTGSSGLCPTNILKPAGFICRAAGSNSTCDPADSCDGTRTTCAAKYAPIGMSCGSGKSCNGAGSCL